VGSVLSSMSIYGEAAKKSLVANNPERVSQLIDMIGENARETMGNMSDIVWSINPINDNGLKLFNKMEAYANSQLSASGVDFNYTVDDKLYNENFLMPVRQNVFFIFKEIINYCATPAPAKSVSVNFGKCGEQFIMEVTNDGKCFSNPSPKEKGWSDVLAGNGFKNLTKRADELGGKIKVELTYTGTKITLQFLINQHYPV
ncbi:MAG: hypothetical protein ABI723_25110, partial [Bacteroidia bacterium]